ncbi:flagellar filament capping protein FliD [Paenibacillus sp. SAF-054]|uniref:flagellar filament capping protein FliD n=1 Tax=unclassified Paenibacillus TaxID=185978 RepID=UPI003F8200D2
MRINGFSGMDVDSMVKSLMTARREPLNKLNQQKQILEWQRDNYREMNSKFFGFNSKLKTSGMSAAMNSYKSVVSGNTDAVKVEATANANAVPMEISVKQLATQAAITTKGTGYGAKLTTTLQEAARLADPAAVIPAKYELHINGVDYEFDKSMSIAEVVSTINKNPDAKAIAKFDEVTGQFNIYSKEYGSEAKLEINDDATQTSTLFQAFNGMTDPGKSSFIGSNALVNFNGAQENGNPIYNEFSSNNFTINGVQVTLLAESGSNGPSKITTQNDPTKALETIKAFINDYNDLISTLNTKVNETRYRDFVPLSDDQKSEMKENDIKNWEEKAKSGMLRNDGMLKTAVSEMRMLTSEFAGQLNASGITMGEYYEGGKLYLDETKLKEALEKDPQSIVDMFQGPVSAPSNGLFDKLQVVMDKAMTNLSDKAGTSKFDGSLTSPFKTESSMGKQLKDYNQRIEDLQKRLQDIETRYYKQFSAMETAMNRLQSQSSSLFGNSSQ